MKLKKKKTSKTLKKRNKPGSKIKGLDQGGLQGGTLSTRGNPQVPHLRSRWDPDPPPFPPNDSGDYRKDPSFAFLETFMSQ